MSTERIRELEQEVADLRAQVEALASQRVRPVRERSSRREVLRRGVILAGSGAAVAAVAQPGAAAAADGDPLIAGSDTTSTGSTGVLSTVSDGAAFYAESSGSGATTGLTGVSSSGDGTGVFGFASATSGATSGVNGESASPNGVGVFGLNTVGGVGVQGFSSDASGVGMFGLLDAASAGAGAAVLARSQASGSIAVRAEVAGGGTGVHADGGLGGVGVRASGTAAAIRLVPSGPPPSTTTPFRQGGELYVDDSGDLWFCRVHGSPGTWVRLTPSNVPAGSVSLTPISPYRAYDSRSAGSGGPLRAGQRSRPSVGVKVDLTTGLSSPLPPLVGLLGVTYNVTITGTVGAGWLAVLPGDATSADVSTINWSSSGVTMANASFSGVDAEQRLSVFVGGALGAATDFIIDITGYLR